MSKLEDFYTDTTDATNITKGTLPDSVIPSTITRDTELTSGLATKLGTTAKAADSQKLDGIDSLGFAKIDGDYAKDFKCDTLFADDAINGYVHVMSRGHVTAGQTTNWGFHSGEGANLYSYATGYSNKVALYPRTVADSSNVFVAVVSDNLKVKLRADGNCYNDGAWSTSNADYAEYFEWSDGNVSDEDRVGYSVVFDVDNTIRKATAGDDTDLIIGVVSKSAGVVGDDAELLWNDKWLRDDYNRKIMTDITIYTWEMEIDYDDGQGVRMVEVSHRHDSLPDGLTPPPEATTEIRQEAALNPAYDPEQNYVPRAERKEWETIGLLGKLRIRVGQPIGSRWMKMRDISAGVEEWLVR